MSRHLLSHAAVAVLALGLAGAAHSQQVTADDSVEIGLARLGIAAPDAGMLDADQILEIENVLNSTDDDAEKVARIERILDTSPTTGGMTAAQLQDSVAAGLAQLGITSDKIEGLSLTEAAEIENVLASSDEDALKVARIEQILALDAVQMSPDAQQLRDSVGAEMAMLGLTDVSVSTLSLSELAEIEGVTNSTDSDDIKRDRIQAILMQ